MRSRHSSQDPHPLFPPSLDRPDESGAGGAAVAALNRSVDVLENGALAYHAVTSLDLKRGYADARRLDILTEAGHSCGPLHGVPVLVKDNIDVEGLPSTNGTVLHDGRLAGSDAIVIRRLRRAGALPFGKANMDELAMGVTGANSRFPRTLNSRDRSRLPGGSSGGSAVAVATGIVVAALGTDTGGSVRTPSAFNGVTALRPTTGLLPLGGVTPLSPMFDTVGPMGWNVDMVSRLLVAMSPPFGPTPSGPLTAFPYLDGGAPLTGLRIGIPRRHFFERADDDVAVVVMEAARVLVALGAILVDIELPGAEHAPERMSRIMLADAFSIHRAVVDSGTLNPAVQERIDLGRRVTAQDYREAVEWKDSWGALVGTAFDAVDVVLTPTTPVVAPAVGDDPSELASVQRATQFTFPWSLAGTPALSLPCGLASGMPVGMQLVGPRGSDIPILRIGAHYEHEVSWNKALVRSAAAGAYSETRED